MRLLLFSILSTIILAGCGGGTKSNDGRIAASTDPISGVLPKGSDAAAQLDIANTGMRMGASYVGEVSIYWGQHQNDPAVYAAFSEDAALGPPPSFDATYSGKWRVALIDMDGLVTQDGGNVVLNANAGTGTLTGSSGQFTLDGRFTNNSVSGTVLYDGIAAPVEGAIGTSGTIGVFAGHDADHVIAGGFIAD